MNARATLVAMSYHLDSVNEVISEEQADEIAFVISEMSLRLYPSAQSAAVQCSPDYARCKMVIEFRSDGFAKMLVSFLDSGYDVLKVCRSPFALRVPGCSSRHAQSTLHTGWAFW